MTNQVHKKEIHRLDDGIVIELIQRRPNGACIAIIQIPVHVMYDNAFSWKRDTQDYFRELLAPLGLLPTSWESLHDIPKRMWTTRCDAKPIPAEPVVS